MTLHFRQLFALELGEAVAHDMRLELFRKLTTLPMSFFNKTKFGRIISRMTSDIDSVRVAVQDVAFVVTIQAVQMTVAALLMAWYNWKLFSLMLLLVPGIWLVNQNYRREVSHRLRKLQVVMTPVSSGAGAAANTMAAPKSAAIPAINHLDMAHLILRLPIPVKQPFCSSVGAAFQPRFSRCSRDCFGEVDSSRLKASPTLND